MAKSTALPEQHDRAPKVSAVTETLWCLGCCRDQPQTLIRLHRPRTVIHRCTGCGQTAARHLPGGASA